MTFGANRIPMKSTKSRVSALFVSLFLFLAPALALAGTVKDYLRTKQVELTELVKNDAASEKLVTVFDSLLDYSALAEASLAEEWGKITPEQRAETVRSYLTDSGFPRELTTSVGFGKTKPIADNSTNDGRQRNRRVELIVSGERIGQSTDATSQP